MVMRTLVKLFLFLIIAFPLITYLIFKYERTPELNCQGVKFNQIDWKKLKPIPQNDWSSDRFCMIFNYAKEIKLKGKTEKEIIELFGEPSKNDVEKNVYHYDLNLFDWFSLRFEKGVVFEYYIHQE